MAAKEGKPSCMDCCASDWKASTYDKAKFEGTWDIENDACGQKGSAMCCGKALVTNHCMCYTCVCYYCCYIPLIADLTWTCGDNCWWSQGGSIYIYGEGDVVYHKYGWCPWEKWVKAGTGKDGGVELKGGGPEVDAMQR